MTHNDADDRPAEIFGGTTTLHADADRQTVFTAADYSLTDWMGPGTRGAMAVGPT